MNDAVFPVFTWVQIQSLAPSLSPMLNHRLLVIDPVAAQKMSRELGIRSWRILESLVLASTPMPEYENRNVYRGTIPALLDLARGTDKQEGWGKDTMRPILKRLQDRHYFSVKLGKPRGRGKGQGASDYILSDSLFFGSPMTSPHNVTDANSNEAHHLVAETHSLSPRIDADSYAPEPSDIPHEYEMNGNNHVEELRLAVYDEISVRQAIQRQLENWNWTTNLNEVLEKYPLELISEWIIHIQDMAGISNPGALLRKRLETGTPPPNSESTLNNKHIIFVREGKLNISSEEDFINADLPTVSWLMEQIEKLPQDIASAIKDKVANAKAIDPNITALTWRRIMSDELQKIGEHG